MNNLGAVGDGVGGIRGQVLRQGDDGFNTARRVWNGMIDRVPAMIVRCADADDVVAAIAIARASGLSLAVRGGGHNVAGYAVCDGGIVIDLSLLKGIRVDPNARTARAEAGLTWGEFDLATGQYGLATTGGLISSTGIAGLTLGGGLGWLMRAYGLACDNLLSVELVTADGRHVQASAAEHADLFWGVRGGGGNFGVITAFEYRLHPVVTVLAGTLVYPWPRARAVLRAYRNIALAAPDELTAHALLHTGLDGEPAVTLLACYCGDVGAGERVLQPLRAFGPPSEDTIAPRPYTQWQSLLDDGSPPGLRNYWQSGFLRSIDDDALDMMLHTFEHVPAARSSILIERMGGAIGRLEPDATAFPHRQAEWDLLIASVWEDPDDDTANIMWARETFAALDPWSRGLAYVNYLGTEDHDRVRQAYGDGAYRRLVTLKHRYDPTNLFRLNQNILPMENI